MLRNWIAGVGVVALFATAGLARADILTPYVGVQFVQGGPALGADQVAGVVPQDNFNPVSVNNSTGANGTTADLLDAGGVATAVTLSHTSYDGYHSLTDTSTTNGALLNGEDKSGNGTASYTFNDVPQGTYSLIAYIENDYPYSGATNANITVGGTTYYVTDEAVTGGTPAFSLANNTDPDARIVGNYVEFNDITPVNGSITLTNYSPSGSGMTAAINGLQLVQSQVPEPTSLTLIVVSASGLLMRRRRKMNSEW